MIESNVILSKAKDLKGNCVNVHRFFTSFRMTQMLVVVFVNLVATSTFAQQPVKLNLKRTIELANDSSLSAFRYQNMYLSGYWEYRTYKANRLPSLTLNLTPAQYYRYITQRYDSNTDMDVYREQQMFSASGGLSIKQNFDLTGGTF